MDDHHRPTDDISELWGADGPTAWEPAPLRRPVRPPIRANGHGHGGQGDDDRLDALEQEVQALVDMVERVEALVDERLSRLEQQMAEMATRIGPDQPRGPRGMGRISGVIRSPRAH